MNTSNANMGTDKLTYNLSQHDHQPLHIISILETRTPHEVTTFLGHSLMRNDWYKAACCTHIKDDVQTDSTRTEYESRNSAANYNCKFTKYFEQYDKLLISLEVLISLRDCVRGEKT